MSQIELPRQSAIQHQARATIVCADGYAIIELVAGSDFRTLNGLAIDSDGRILVASALGESLFAYDRGTGLVETVVGPPLGAADDLIVTKGGDVIWTAVLEGVVRIRAANGEIRDIAHGLIGINSIALTRDGKRLFVGLVFNGDGLYEIDLAGKRPPRQVVAKLGGLNAFAFGPDGMIYGPSWERGEVLRIDPESGQSKVIARGFVKPGSVKFDANDLLYVLDDAAGSLYRVDLESGNKHLVIQLATATDNMIFDSSNLLLVSNMADNSLQEVDVATGQARLLKVGALAFPRAIAAPANDGGLLYIADTGSLRSVDPKTGAVTDLARSIATELSFPTDVSISGSDVIVTCEFAGSVQVVDRKTANIKLTLAGFDKPSGAVRLLDESILVAEPALGRVTRQRGIARETFVAGLLAPTALCVANAGSVYIGDSGSGKIEQADIRTGKLQPIASGFGSIRALALAPGEQLLALDTLRKELVSIDLHSSGKRIIASNLPVGILSEPYPRSGGIAVGSDGSVYVAADASNAIYRITQAT